MIRDIANHVLSIGDKVVIISRIRNPFTSEGRIVGLKEILDEQTDEVKQRIQVKVDVYGATKASWFSPMNLVKKESDFH